MLNQFLANVLILYPLKTSENQRFSDVCREYKMGTLGQRIHVGMDEMYEMDQTY